MIVQAIKCNKCGDTVFSRTRHDFRSCTCGDIYIDGGRDYVKVGGTSDIKIFDLEIEQTQEKLYNDWNFSKDRYGVIKGEKNGLC